MANAAGHGLSKWQCVVSPAGDGRSCHGYFELRYPVGIAFGLGFDTSSEVAVLAMAEVSDGGWLVPDPASAALPHSSMPFARSAFLTALSIQPLVAQIIGCVPLGSSATCMSR